MNYFMVSKSPNGFEWLIGDLVVPIIETSNK